MMGKMASDLRKNSRRARVVIVTLLAARKVPSGVLCGVMEIVL